MTSFISVILKTEDEKAEKIKDITKHDLEIDQLEEKIKKIKSYKSDLNEQCSQCNTQLDKMERKRKKLEKYFETELGKVRIEGTQISEDIDKLNVDLAANLQATKDLAKQEVVTEPEPCTAPPAESNRTNNRLKEFMAQTIKEKENDLECPICLEIAEPPIYMCQVQIFRNSGQRDKNWLTQL